MVAPPLIAGVCIDGVWSSSASLAARSPIDGSATAMVGTGGPAEVAAAAQAAARAFTAWRLVPAPVRGALVRRIGERVRREADALAELITSEVGKIPGEARGEVQEWVDICEFATGLSRQIGGLTLPSERPAHRLMEQWHPLGPVGVITAFNFPVAVWAWNAMLALVCGDTVVWKPSEKAMRCAIAVTTLVNEEIAAAGHPPGLCSLVCGGATAGQALAESPLIPLVSATGSVAMGRKVGQAVAGRLGRSLLELGGNNAAIVTPSADEELVVRAVTFAAVGTAGQRCTTLRRLIVHRSRLAPLVRRLTAVFAGLPIGDPRKPGILVGPLIDEAAVRAYETALSQALRQGGRVHGGGRLTDGVPAGGHYVRPALVEIPAQAPVVQEETFAPLLYVMPYDDLDEAIRLNNDVPQGLSSAILTCELRDMERFLGPAGSDCGLANVNMGTSGAEIGGAFGGEKTTGGGRESGSDSWKVYMRRVTSAINGGSALPLAQGIEFG